MEQVSLKIGERLKEIRNTRQLTLDDVAELTGVSKPMLGQIERGQREGSIRGDIDAAFEAVAVVGMVLTTTLHYIREAEQRAEEGCDCAEAFAAAERSLTARICDYVHHANA